MHQQVPRHRRRDESSKLGEDLYLARGFFGRTFLALACLQEANPSLLLLPLSLLLLHQAVGHSLGGRLPQPLGVLHLDLLAATLLLGLLLVLAVAEAEGVILGDRAGVDGRERLPLASLATGSGRVLGRNLGRGAVGVDILDVLAERDLAAIAGLGRLAGRRRPEQIGVVVSSWALVRGA